MAQNRFGHHTFARRAFACCCHLFVDRKSCGVNPQFNEVPHVDLSLDDARRYPEVLWILTMLAFPIDQLIVIGELLAPKLCGQIAHLSGHFRRTIENPGHNFSGLSIEQTAGAVGSAE